MENNGLSPHSLLSLTYRIDNPTFKGLACLSQAFRELYGVHCLAFSFIEFWKRIIGHNRLSFVFFTYNNVELVRVK